MHCNCITNNTQTTLVVYNYIVENVVDGFSRTTHHNNLTMLISSHYSMFRTNTAQF